jgi:hypothetical protein
MHIYIYIYSIRAWQALDYLMAVMSSVPLCSIYPAYIRLTSLRLSHIPLPHLTISFSFSPLAPPRGPLIHDLPGFPGSQRVPHLPRHTYHARRPARGSTLGPLARTAARRRWGDNDRASLLPRSSGRAGQWARTVGPSPRPFRLERSSAVLLIPADELLPALSGRA